MSDPAVQPSAAAEHTGSGLSQWQRVGSIFSAPSKTFEDIRLGRLSWWLPFLISVFFSYVLFAAITMKVGWKQVAANSVATNPAQMERINQLPPEGRDRALNSYCTICYPAAPNPVSKVPFTSSGCLISPNCR